MRRQWRDLGITTSHRCERPDRHGLGPTSRAVTVRRPIPELHPPTLSCRCRREPFGLATVIDVPPSSSGRPAGGIAFLLAQVGAQAAARFAERVQELDLTPALAGILRALSIEPGRSQQALSEQLSLIPSRVVAFIDDLEGRGLVERRRNPGDRRLYALHLTEAGTRVMQQLATAAREHEQELTAGLTREQRAVLAEALGTIAERQGIQAGVHPGYRMMGVDTAKAKSPPAS
jgi:DNA-binding MarR family transcriptional regulator